MDTTENMNDDFDDWDKCEEFVTESSNCNNEDVLESWETATIPIFNQEKKQLEERKLVEEADIKLSNELFLGDQIKIVQDHNKPVTKINKEEKEKEKPPSIRSNLMKKQKEQAQIRRKKKTENKRLLEIYGEASVDKYDELYGDIAN